MVHLENRNKTFYEQYLKRFLDVTIAAVSLILLMPFFLVISILVYIKLGSPIIFKQKRPGKNEVVFDMYKFRTMIDARDSKGNLLPDDIRLTKFGKLLRSTSLDELPELWNILKGDMSFVGPRPQLVRDMVFMTDCQRQRHTILPGLTGLAQTRGRNGIAWEQKLELDIVYLQNINFQYDLKIVIDTLYQVLFRKKSKFTDVGINEVDLAEDFGDYLLNHHKISVEEYTLKQLEARKLLGELHGKI